MGESNSEIVYRGTDRGKLTTRSELLEEPAAPSCHELSLGDVGAYF